MKRLIIIAFLGLIVFNCKSETQQGGYVINGKAEDVYNGIRVYLKAIDEQGKETPIDTAIVMEETFTFKGIAENPSVHFLTFEGTPGNLFLMLENANIDVVVDKSSILESKVSGSKSNDDLMAFQRGIKEINIANRDALMAYQEIQFSEETKKKDSLLNVLENLGIKMNNHPLNFVKEHNDSYFSLNLIGLEANKAKFNVVGFLEAFDNLNPDLQKSSKGLEVKRKLDELYEAYKKIEHLEIGKVAPEFEAPTPEGTMVSLNDIKGKVTIIDFWAAWCGPCRRENPNVVRIYNKYHKEGLEIIGVSLDGSRNQKDPKQAWLDAIEKDKLTWNHVSNLNYFNDPVAKLYNINAIPATFILDEDGRIVAKSLRGQALENKVMELLGK